VSSVNIHYLLANDTVDDIIWDVVQSKLENLGQVFSFSMSTHQERKSLGLTIERKAVDAAEQASTLHRVLAIMCIFFELIRKGSCSRIGLALFPKELMSTTFPLLQTLPLDSEEDDDLVQFSHHFQFFVAMRFCLPLLSFTRQVSVAAYIIGWSMPRSPDAGRARMLILPPMASKIQTQVCVESKGILSPDSNRIMAFGNRIHDFVVPGRKIFWLSALDVGTAGT
ncbi:hypothetical protein HID58_020373, partial [Brassica napus]